jgi:hypothetical protein
VTSGDRRGVSCGLGRRLRDRGCHVRPDLLGNPLTAHYTADYRTFDGLAFPTRRHVLRRSPGGTTLGDRLITLDLHSVAVS